GPTPVPRESATGGRGPGACPLQGDPGRVGLLLVLTRPELIFRHLPWGKADPLGSRRAVLVEVQLWVGCEDLDAAANQQRDEQDVEEVAEADPQRKAEIDAAIHGGLSSPSLTPSPLPAAAY